MTSLALIITRGQIHGLIRDREPIGVTRPRKQARERDMTRLHHSKYKYCSIKSRPPRLSKRRSRQPMYLSLNKKTWDIVQPSLLYLESVLVFIQSLNIHISRLLSHRLSPNYNFHHADFHCVNSSIHCISCTL